MLTACSAIRKAMEELTYQGFDLETTTPADIVPGAHRAPFNVTPMGVDSIQFRPPTRTHAPWGCIARAGEVTKLRKVPTRKVLLLVS